MKMSQKIKIGIIGGGFVGSATALLECNNVEVLIYDLDKTKCKPQTVEFKDLDDCKFIFICVPTPMNQDGSCHTKIAEKVITQIRQVLNPSIHIVVRSTVPVDFCKNHGVSFMPEFLTEKNWKMDFYECQRWVLGTDDSKESSIKQDFTDLIKTSQKENKILHNWIDFMSTSEAAMVKYFRNCFLATKVSFCNEIAQFCKSKLIDYEAVRRVATMDYRITGFHTMVPGPDGRTGFGGTCFGKDTASLLSQMEEMNIESKVLKGAVERNNTIDRPEMDWHLDLGRTVI